MSRLRAVLLTTDYPPRSGGIARLLDELVRGTDDTVDWRVLDVRAESPRQVPASGWRATRWLLAVPAGDRLVVCGHPYLAAPAVMTARLARNRSGSADAISHWLASSITTTSKTPGSNGKRPRAESEVTAQQGSSFVTFGNKL